MGIKDFSGTFKHTRTITWRDFKGKTVAIDAMTELYRASLGAKSVKLLTDREGNPTLHLTVILANIIAAQAAGVKLLWCFDHDAKSVDNAVHHNCKSAVSSVRRPRSSLRKPRRRPPPLRKTYSSVTPMTSPSLRTRAPASNNSRSGFSVWVRTRSLRLS